MDNIYNNHLVELTNCLAKKHDYGYCDVFDFTHPFYWVANYDNVLGKAYEEYKTAFVTFTVYKN